MQIDELPAGEQNQCPDMDMNRVVGTHDILMLCFDTLRYDVSKAEEAAGGTPVLNSHGGLWEKRHAPGNFTYPSHFAIFAGFLPSPAEPHSLRSRKWLFFPVQAGTGRIPPKGSYPFTEATFVQSLANKGYETICIGGVNFFSKRNELGRVFPGYFTKSYWLPIFGCTAPDSTEKQIDFALKKLENYSADKRIFMYINFSAIHYPHCHYVKGKTKDDKESHAAALRYIDSQLPRLFETLYPDETMNQPLSRYVDYMYSYPHKTAYRPFPAPVSLLPYLEQLQGRKASLYFHIPFCSHKCGYCNLFSLQTNRTEYIATYLDTLHRQAQQLSPLTAGLTFDSFAIGGGTPLLLTVPQLEQLMATAALFGVHPSHAFTSVETSPEYADRPRLNVLKKAGVSRVSIGIQSFQDEELKAIKRRPRQNTIYQALDDIRQMDFPYFNIDLIYGIKGQTVESFLYSLEEALRFQPNELFIYPLYVRQGTGITEREPDDVCFRMYRAACKLLQAKGFLQTSMRRFIHHPSTDAEVSCGDEVMLSCGSGGRSYLGDLHYATRYTVCQQCIAREIDEYMATTDFTVARNGFILSAKEQQQRFIIKNLMYYMGIDKAEYTRRFGEPLDRTPLFRQLAEQYWIEETPERIRLTPEGLGYSDYIGQLFITPEIRQLMETYSY